MAAGLSIPENKFDEFSRLFDDISRKLLDDSALKGVVFSDGELKPEEFSLHTADILRQGGPWGQGFPEPVFDGDFKVLHQKLVGEKHLKLMLEPMFKGHPTNLMVDGIAFNIDVRRWPDASVNVVRLAYRLDINEFRGNQSVQLMVETIQAK